MSTQVVEAVLGVAGETSAVKRRTRRSALIRIGALAALLLALTVIGYSLGWFDVQRVTGTIRQLQSGRNLIAVGVFFFVVFAAMTGVGFPALPFTVAGGAIFGHLLGSVLSWGAALAGTMLGYLLARGVGREAARRWLTKRTVGAALTESTSFFTLLYLRLVPVVPLSVVNFAAGLARTRFTAYIGATAIGILPTTVVFAYFADSIVRGLEGARTHAYADIAIASGVLLLVSLVPFAVRRWRAASAHRS